MSKLFQNKAFIIGFLIGIILFSLIIYLSYLFNKMTCADCGWKFGFPFALYEAGTILHLDKIIWTGLIADILIALIVSFLFGLIFKFIWLKIASPKLK